MTSHKPKAWNQWLSLAEFWYNTSFHSALQMTPFQVVYGYEPPQLTFELVAQSKVDFVDQWLKERQIMTKVLQESLRKAQNRMKQQVDKHRTDREILVGD